MLAKEYGVEFYDTDLIMEKMTGLPLMELYEKKGISGFMQVEEAVCRKIKENFIDKRIVVAAGSGICDNVPAVNELADIGVFVFIKQDLNYCIEKIVSEIKLDDDGKIIAAPAYIMAKKPKNINAVRDILKEKLEERNNHYASMAEITVNIKDAPKEENFKLLLSMI